jgi:hypothetical protein
MIRYMYNYSWVCPSTRRPGQYLGELMGQLLVKSFKIHSLL